MMNEESEGNSERGACGARFDVVEAIDARVEELRASKGSVESNSSGVSLMGDEVEIKRIRTW